MPQERLTSVYADYYILDLLAGAGKETDDERLVQDRTAARLIWERFKKYKVRIVTSVEEMELDFVIHMNRGGLCVTDTFQITDNIDDFERWEMADRDDTRQWRAIVDLYDQLEIVNDKGGLPHISEDVTAILRRRDPCQAMTCGEKTQKSVEQGVILRDCASVLHKYYDAATWSDLKHIRYDLNWEVLREVLPRHARNTALKGQGTSENKNLLGLLNRLVNIGKKSCPRLPMEERHIDFVLDIVTKKYCQEEIDRHISHIVHSLRCGVDYHLVIDSWLVEGFAAGEDRLRMVMDREQIRLEVIRPVELLERIDKARD